VFDCDGLLLDTEECWTRGEALFAAYGRTFGPEHKRRLLGASGEASGRILASVLDQPSRERELARELLDFCWGEVVEGAAPRPGAVELVEELRGTVPIGIASNSPRALVEAALDAAGLDGPFDVILGVDDVRRPKPDAEIYLAACERLGGCAFALHSARRLADRRGGGPRRGPVCDRGALLPRRRALHQRGHGLACGPGGPQGDLREVGPPTTTGCMAEPERLP
jgi:beta-phosphoglucomutase-like phosphatase (HAD superfamily)